ncbi:hypothetical protein GTO27_00365, partial [Candidatus Bathyarchaeota archaeon]|nr:hypothetical protein [Candidatus Bathyarchaeota archaeon]
VIDYMTAGVAMARQNSKTHGWIPFKFPDRIKMLSMSKAERAMKLKIGNKVKRKCHISAVRASKEVIPYLRIIFENDPRMAAGLAKWFNLDPAMLEYLAGGKKDAAAVVKLLS